MTLELLAKKPAPKKKRPAAKAKRPAAKKPARKKKPPPKLDAHKEAIKWFKGRVPVTKRKWRNLDHKARQRAFTVAGVAKLDVINSVLKDVTRAIRNGESLGQFKKRVSAKLTKAWKEERPHHVELIYRNNIQAAFAHGREMEMRTPQMLSSHPYWMHSSILDSRTTQNICRPRNGLILPATHKYWLTHTPPLHHNCRSTKRALTVAQAKKRGIAKRAPRDTREGENADFGKADPLDWKPKLSDYPPVLAREYRRKRR